MGKKLRFEWEVPEEVLARDFKEEEFVSRVKKEAVLEMFKERLITTGHGASLLNITRQDFWDLLASKGIPFFNYTEEELAEDLKAVDLIKEELRE